MGCCSSSSANSDLPHGVRQSGGQAGQEAPDHEAAVASMAGGGGTAARPEAVQPQPVGGGGDGGGAGAEPALLPEDELFIETGGAYRTIQKLGAGSFGFVVLAKSRSGEDVAIKVGEMMTRHGLVDVSKVTAVSVCVDT